MSAHKLRVAVLRGGPSPEYEVSLRTGQHFLSHLGQEGSGYDPVDIFINRAGVWHHRGLPIEPHVALKHVDVAINAMHGAYGEDGQVQALLERLKVPYTGAEAVPSALAMNKDLTKSLYKKHGLLTPSSRVIKKDAHTETELIEVFRNFLHPVVVKPAGSGSSLGIHLAHTWEELKQAVQGAFEHSDKVLVEEYIRGREATCGVIDNFRNERIYALIPVEIVKTSPFFDYESKYSGKAVENCPGSFTTELNKKIEDAARIAHTALGLRHYSRTDMIVTPRGNVYVLETNSLPGFTKESPFPKALQAAGIQERIFIDHLIGQARK